MEPLAENRWLVVGLGNPGPEYEKTRHNIGFMVVDHLAGGSNVSVKRVECEAVLGRTELGDSAVELAKPLTFMNLSGDAVNCLLKKPERKGSGLIVISDDLALPTGKMRIRPKGSHGGHNGLRSLIERLGTNEFIRLRIGIMPDHPINDPKRFVLAEFSKGERQAMEQMVENGADAVRDIIRVGVERAMGIWNGNIEGAGSSESPSANI